MSCPWLRGTSRAGQVFGGQPLAFEAAEFARRRVDVLLLIGERVRRREPPDLGVGVEQAAAVATAGSLDQRRPRGGLGHQNSGVQVEARLDDLSGDDDPAAVLTRLAEDGGQPLSSFNAAKSSVQQRAVPGVGPQLPIEALGGVDRVHHDEGERARPVALQHSGRYRLVVARIGGQSSHRAETSQTDGERLGPFEIRNLNWLLGGRIIRGAEQLARRASRTGRSGRTARRCRFSPRNRPAGASSWSPGARAAARR